ncbi:MAG: HK97 family phage prohead protease [Lachnospiraceae bacterium]|nr:HK97 family phage prohead protease [Lachnospiraceae bacterium]
MSKSELPKLENRSYLFEVRAEKTETGAKITGRPIVFDSKTDLGWFDEIIEKNALDKADLSDVRFLVNHDLSKIPLARSRKGANGNTMRLLVDEKGLLIEVDLDIENNTEAKNLYSAVSRGDITGMSFMFGIRDETWEDLDTEHPTRRIKEISSVIEVSAVTFPAYQDTEISARCKETLENVRKVVETARSKGAPSAEADEIEVLKLKIRAKRRI